MKTAMHLMMMVSCGIASNSFASEQSPLSGEYQVIPSIGCEQQLTTLKKLEIRATDQGIETAVGPYTFQVGTVTSAPGTGFFNEFLVSYTGSFSDGGYEFKAVKASIDRLNPNPIYAGEVDLILKNDILEIDNSFSDAGTVTTPAPVSVCLLKKL